MSIKVNIMICGKSGVGKTTLINTLIGVKTGKTGIGRPVTEDITSYTVPGSSLICYDTPGFEIKEGQVQEAISSFCDKIKALQVTMDEDQMIDALLYCVCYQGPQRFEDTEADFVKKVNNDLHIPVFIIFTQYTGKPTTWLTDSYRQVVLESLKEHSCVLRDDQLRPILCYDISLYGGDYTVHAYGLDKLVDILFTEAAVNLANKLATAKITTLETASERAENWLILYSFAAAAEVAIVAAPGADLAVLAGNETIMAGHIFKIMFINSNVGSYDRDRIIGALGSLAVPLIGSLGGPVVFNEVVKTLGLFFAPFTGGLSVGASIVTGAAVGFAVTFALGHVTIDLFKRLLTGSITLEQLEKRDPKVLAQAKTIMKTQFEAGQKYAKEHPNQILIRKNQER